MSYFEGYLAIGLVIGIWILFIYTRDEIIYDGDIQEYRGKQYSEIPFIWFISLTIIPFIYPIVLFFIVAEWDRKHTKGVKETKCK